MKMLRSLQCFQKKSQNRIKMQKELKQTAKLQKNLLETQSKPTINLKIKCNKIGN